MADWTDSCPYGQNTCSRFAQAYPEEIFYQEQIAIT